MDIENNRTATSNLSHVGVMGKIEAVLNFLNHLIISFITLYMTYVCIKAGLVNTSLHAWLMTLGYQLLMAEGILSFYSGNLWSTMFLSTRQSKTTAHWLLMLTGSILATVGAIYKIAIKGPHFYSIHSIAGLIATIIVAFNLLSGLAALYSQSLRKFIIPIYSKTIHAFLGLSGFIIAMISQFYGYNTGFLRRKVEGDFLDALKIMTVITILLTVVGPIRTLYRNVRITLLN